MIGASLPCTSQTKEEVVALQRAGGRRGGKAAVKA